MMEFKDRRIVYKEFKHKQYLIDNVPYQVNEGIIEPTEEDLILSGAVILRLMAILGYMEKNKLLFFEYDTDLI